MSLKNSKKTRGQVAGSIEQAPKETEQPLGTGSVTTPASPEKPTGYQWDMLEKAWGPKGVKTFDSPGLRNLKQWAVQNGFSATGQFMKAINARLGEE